MRKMIRMISFICVFVFIFSWMNQPVKAAEAPVTIDGYYDDWEDKPMTIFTWHSNNGKANHDVSMIKDEEYIYIYVKMHELYRSPMPIDAINLFVNGVNCQLFVRYANADNNTDWGKRVDLSKDGTLTGLHPFTYYPNNSLGDAAITVSTGAPNDRMEIRVNIKELEKVMNLKQGTINNGSRITLKLPNVGEGTIELMGTSTGAVLGLILCIAVVIAVAWRKNRKMRTV